MNDNYWSSIKRFNTARKKNRLLVTKYKKKTNGQVRVGLAHERFRTTTTDYEIQLGDRQTDGRTVQQSLSNRFPYCPMDPEPYTKNNSNSYE